METLHVSRDAVASLEVDNKTIRAGFWDDDPEHRTTKTKLSNFANAMDHATVHPDSFLGRAIEASQNLDGCHEDAQPMRSQQTCGQSQA